MTTDDPRPLPDDVHELAALRYGAPDPLLTGPLTPTIELQLRHRSVRSFLPDPVTDAELELIVAAAQSASQSSNLQLWSVVAVRDADRKRRLSEANGGRPYIENAPVFLAWIADLRRAAEVARAQGAEVETVGYLENTLVAFADSGIAAQNALLAAESMGIGGVFVGSLRNNPAAVVAELGLPEYAFPVFGLALGRPDPEEPAGIKPRLPRAAVLHHERYDPDAWREPVEQYESRLRDYYAPYGRDDHSWQRTLVARLSSVEGLHGRHRMRDWLNDQGLAGR